MPLYINDCDDTYTSSNIISRSPAVAMLANRTCLSPNASKRAMVSIPSNLESESGASPPNFRLKFRSTFCLKPPPFGLFVKGVDCPLKNREENFCSTPLTKLPPSIFQWVQTAPTRYRDRSHCHRGIN